MRFSSHVYMDARNWLDSSVFLWFRKFRFPRCSKVSTIGFHKETVDVIFADIATFPLQWRHNERDDVSKYRRLDCLFDCLFRRRSKKTSKLRVTAWPLCLFKTQVTIIRSLRYPRSSVAVPDLWSGRMYSVAAGVRARIHYEKARGIPSIWPTMAID